MFRAIQHRDRTTLRILADTFIGTTKDVAALLCLDHTFPFTPTLQGLSFLDIQESLSLFSDYIRLLNKILRDDSLVEGSNRQRLFGFQVLGENRYLVPRRAILHEKLANRPGVGGDGCSCGSEDLRRSIVATIKARIRDRTKTQNDTCFEVHGFSPCLQLFTQKKCNPPSGQGSCAFQHIQPEQLTVEWYRDRLSLLLLQIQILESANFHDLRMKE